MKGITLLSRLIGGFLLTWEILLPATAQVTSDGTTNTIVNSSSSNFNILNGIQNGNNLFHSFSEFSIPTGSSATFKNSSTIVNIINRVTGGKISNIDGLIKANGNANLFLINPAGIVFGENARLDIGGSFLGTTAESILFEDGLSFSAHNPESKPLLIVSVLVGLQMGSNSGSITVEGNGHEITGGIYFPSALNQTDRGLQVDQGQTLGLIGAGINLTGGIIRVPGGNIQLSSIEQGRLKFEFDNNSQSWQFDTSEVQSFGDINLSNKSLLETSGFVTGDIQLQGKNINFKNASIALIQNLGNQTSGKIIVNASDSIKLADSIRNAPDTVTSLGTITGVISSRLSTESLGTGKGGDIFVSGKNLFISDGSVITGNTFSNEDAGNIEVNIESLIEITEFAPLNLTNLSAIGTATFSSGNSGIINISAQNIKLLDGAVIAASSFNSGQGRDIQVNVTEDLTIIGYNPIFLSAGIINSSTNTGNNGQVTVNASRLSILDGGVITSLTLAQGNSGELILNASESVTISGGATEVLLPSSITSSARILDIVTRQTFGFPDKPSGDSGNIILNTPSLTVTDGAKVSVSNEGFGDSGNLEINASKIFLDTGSIAAFSASGEGGNIDLNIQDSLSLRHTSAITSEAKSAGNGGNININSPIIAGFENSDIIANAVEGNGGNIQIKTQGLFGLVFRDIPTEKNDITASSEFGVNGTVIIKNIGIDPSSGLVELPVELSDESQQIATGCSNNIGSSFVFTGRGGIPQNPNQYYLNLKRTWSDLRDVSAYLQGNNHVENPKISNQPAILEATGFIRNTKGEIELVALENTPLRTKQAASCSTM